MKKIHLIAAAAALLLSGGVFMKANNFNLTMSEINALCDDGPSLEELMENPEFAAKVSNLKSDQVTRQQGGYAANQDVYINGQKYTADYRGYIMYTIWDCVSGEKHCAKVNGMVLEW